MTTSRYRFAPMLVSLALAGCAHDSSKKTASMDENTSTSTASASEGSRTAASWDGVVQSIDPAGSMSASGAVGAAAAGSGAAARSGSVRAALPGG